MIKDEFLGERKQALEEAFFKKHEAEQLAKYRVALERKATREELGKATGVNDPGVLDTLIDLGVSSTTLTALALAPLLHVAWADGKVQPTERDAITRAAHDRGIAEGTPAHALLSSWLEHAPEPELDHAWAAYTRALVQKLSSEQRVALRDQVVSFARGVAEAAGGFLGVKTISAAEEQALSAIGRAFE